ncbi:MAG: superoxide dismutase [Candidatus Babeliales bacterium]|nr:superoxide dismutase [Candidatus Babeliales bacterium]
MNVLILSIVLLLSFNIFSGLDFKYPYTVPTLPYEYKSLEPYIDEQTMKLHHDAHHKTYVDNLNAVLVDNKKLQAKDLEWLLRNLNTIEDTQTQTTIKNNGGGHWNHSFFWKIMAPDCQKLSNKKLMKEIKKQFGSFDKFKDQFNAAAKKVFGSGWAWLCVDQNKKLVIITTPNQESPISQGLEPILGLDVWEHAYYLKYQNKRIDYISSFWHVINWRQVEMNYSFAIK